MKISGALAIGLLASAACDGKTLDIGSNDASDRSDVPFRDPANGLEVYPAATIAAASANCDLPVGPVQSPATTGELRALLTGPWLFCHIETYAGAILQSIEFMPNGQWHFFAGSAGLGLVELYGSGEWGYYSVGNSTDAGDDTPFTSSDPVSVVYGPADASYTASESSNLEFFSFEGDPPRMHLTVGAGGTKGLFVRLPALPPCTSPPLRVCAGQ